MSWITNAFHNLPNQWSDLDAGSMRSKAYDLTDSVYGAFTPDSWQKGTFGDYTKHLNQTSMLGGNPFMAYGVDYQGRRDNGASRNDAAKEEYQNAGISAGILAAIFGGSELAGGSGGGSSGGGTADFSMTGGGDSLGQWSGPGADTGLTGGTSSADATGGGFQMGNLPSYQNYLDTGSFGGGNQPSMMQTLGKYLKSGSQQSQGGGQQASPLGVGMGGGSGAFDMPANPGISGRPLNQKQPLDEALHDAFSGISPQNRMLAAALLNGAGNGG